MVKDIYEKWLNHPNLDPSYKEVLEQMDEGQINVRLLCVCRNIISGGMPVYFTACILPVSLLSMRTQSLPEIQMCVSHIHRRCGNTCILQERWYEASEGFGFNYDSRRQRHIRIFLSARHWKEDVHVMRCFIWNPSVQWKLSTEGINRKRVFSSM